MKKTYTHMLMLLTFITIFCASQFSIHAKPKNALKTGAGFRSKMISKLNETNAEKRNLLKRAAFSTILFEENRGQVAQNIKFVSRTPDYNFFLTQSAAIFSIPNRKKPDKCPFILNMQMLGANPNSELQGIEKAATKSGYYIGNDPDKWLTGIENFQKVKINKIYAGIDIIFRGSEEKLEYDFHIAPGAEPGLIRLGFEGVKKTNIDRDGNLIFKFSGGIKLLHQKPSAYQIINGERRAVNVKYIRSGKNQIGFKVGDYDKSRELIIDPLVYASYLGGTAGGDEVKDIAVDRNGFVYTASNERLSPEPWTTYSNILITKFNPDAKTPVYRFSYGGTVDDVPLGMDVDADGKIYLTGLTWSPDFPLEFAEQSSHSINEIQLDFMAFVMRLNEDGSIHYSTYLGGGCAGTYTQNYAYSIAADIGGNAYVTGYTCSADFPVRNGFRTSLQGGFNAFLTKYDSFGRINYSTYFGGGNSSGTDVAADGQGNVYLTGSTSGGLSTTAGAYKTSGAGFAAKFDTKKSGAQSLVFSTYLDAWGTAIALDQSGNSWIAAGAYCGSNCFGSPSLLKLNNSGTALVLAPSLLPGEVQDIAVDLNENLYYVVPDGTNLKAVSLRSDGSPNGEGSFSVGTGLTRVWGIATGPETGTLYIGGHTYSLDFPTTPNAYQPNTNTPNPPNSYFGQGFFAKFQLNVLPQRNPLIFVPGIMGSHLRGNWNGFDVPYWINVNPIATEDLPSVYNLTLDINSPYYTEGLYASDVIKTALYIAPMYKDLLNSLESRGYKPYDISRHVYPNQRCDLSQRSNNPADNPSLFVFPYDWRQDNNLTADKLREYVQCVQQFYPPGTRVNILAHSMGGLVARRYVLQARTGNQPHGLGKVVTLATPYLGASEAIYKLYTGGSFDALSVVASPSTIKFLSPHMPSMHQLFPSRIYHQFNDGIIKESGDVNGNGIPDENYNFSQIVTKLNSDFPETTPGTVGAGFHDFTGQDNWQNDQSGIEYYHIAAEQNQFNTTVGVSIKNSVLCRIVGNTTLTQCHNGIRYIPRKGMGDKTVPIISASRSFENIYLGSPNSKCYVYRSTSPNNAEEKKAEHTEMTKQPIIQNFVAYFLGDVSQQPSSPQMTDCVSSNAFSTISSKFEKNSSKNNGNRFSFVNAKYSSASELTSYASSQYLMISGATEVTVRDETENMASIDENGLLDNQIDGLMNYEMIGENSIMLTFSVGHTYTIEFDGGITPFGFDLVEGIGNEQPAKAVRYNDVNIPSDLKIKFTISPDGSTELKYDSNNDGEFDTLVSPTVNVSGEAASDITPPTVNIEVVRQGSSATATLTAQDTQSGVSRIWYSLNGQNYQLYTFPISLQYSPNPIRIEAFADDTVANRSGLYFKEYTFPPIINPTVTITTPSTSSVFAIGTAVNFAGDFSNDQCDDHTAVWTFDNLSQSGTVNEETRKVITRYTFASAGVYLVALTVNNNCGGIGTADTVDELTAMVVVYDPDGGFVTGGGWFDSPIGAYTPSPSLTGRASFGFNSKYQRGATVPTGNTEFQFRVADFNFKSTSYDWLVVAGAKAQFKGSGTINANGDYGFMLTAIDGQINGGQDKFRIKIWDKSTNAVIYDNQLGSGDNDNPTTAIGGGSIIIHRQ